MTGPKLLGDRQAWNDALDALEEWVRRSVVALSAREPVQLSAAPCLPGGPAPVEVQVRAQALLAQLMSAQRTALVRREQLNREMSYATAYDAG